KSPGNFGAFPKGPRRCDGGKVQTAAFQGRISTPETFFSAKIRQAGIDTHASPGDKEHHVRSSNKMSSLLNGSGIYTGRFEHVILPWQCADDIKLMSCNRMGFFPNKNEGNARCYA